jgi:hypothetical protein
MNLIDQTQLTSFFKTYTKIPDTQEYWHYLRPMKLDDVNLWEEIYTEPGNIEIYGAWSPLAECYLIVHPLFQNSTLGFEIFYGKSAGEEVWLRSKEFGIDLPIYKNWIDDSNTWAA